MRQYSSTVLGSLEECLMALHLRKGYYNVVHVASYKLTHTMVAIASTTVTVIHTSYDTLTIANVNITKQFAIANTWI